jgi:predicted dehydrogenase
MTIRWALLGPGRHAERIVVPQMIKAAGTEVVAVMSRDRARGQAFSKKYGIPKVLTSFDDVLLDREIDALYDATPDGLHAQHAIEAAWAGKHSLIEKPLAVSVPEGEQVVAAGRRHSVKLGVVFNQRHEEVHQEARRMVLQGEIGEIKLASVQIPLRGLLPPPAPTVTNWRADSKMRSVGIVGSIGDHACDTLAYMLGQDIEDVSAFTDGTQNVPPSDRVGGMLMKLSKGAIGYASASFATPFAQRPFEIHGTKGSLIIENSFAYLTGASEDPRPKLTIINQAGSSTRDYAPTECFRLEIEQFNRAIEGKGILAMGDAFYDAIRGGRVSRVAEFMPGQT